MIRLLSLSLAAIFFVAGGGVPVNPQVSAQASQEIPKAATVEIVLLKAPGINVEGSRWEIAYEFRIANEVTLWNARNDLKAGSGKRFGELIKEGMVKGTLRPPASRKVVFRIPFSSEIQERLRNQPRDRVNTPGQMTPEDIRLLKEQEMKSQVFLFYPIISIYDAKLKKQFIIPELRLWDFVDYPQARFEIKVEINNDGSYSVNSSVPARVRASN